MKNNIKYGTLFDCENIENHKRHKLFLGLSDVACLTLTGMKQDGVNASTLRFGGDGEYSAWIVDDLAVIPDHYTLMEEYSHVITFANGEKGSKSAWLKIYDDTGLAAEVVAKEIRVYRAGEYGCLIYIER